MKIDELENLSNEVEDLLTTVRNKLIKFYRANPEYNEILEAVKELEEAKEFTLYNIEIYYRKELKEFYK